MYIKIKHLKNFLLISLCLLLVSVNYFTYVKADTAPECSKSIDADCDGLTDSEESVYGTELKNIDTDGDGYSDGVEVRSGYDPLKPAPGDRIYKNFESSQDNTNNSSESDPSLTDAMSEELKEFVISKQGESISNSDLSDFVEQTFSEKIGPRISLSSLPEVSESEIKVLPQEYGSLSEEERKNKLRKDAAKYYADISYALASNAPVEITTTEDFQIFLDEFEDNFLSLANGNTDYEYFTDIAKRTEMFIEQTKYINVPETMVDMHIKALRILKGFLALSELNYSENDPISKMIFISKVQDLVGLVAEFFENDFQNYNNSLK